MLVLWLTLASCAAEPQPTDRKATPEARALLHYLHSIEGKGCLAGQEENNVSTSSQMVKIKAITGKLPALRGFDIRPESVDPIEEVIRWWKQRGISTLSWHMGAPPREDTYENSKATVPISRVLTTGTTEHRSFLAKLDGVAQRLRRTQDAGVPILWRPWHEMNGTWFWWSKSGPEEFKQLWIFMYEYYTQEKELHNLLWVWSASYEPDARWYPGDRYVDIVGSDVYASSRGGADWRRIYNGLKQIAPQKPAALTENDIIPDPARLKSRQVRFIWFLTWHSEWLDKNEPDLLRSVYNHNYTITADELPRFR
jgi:hypothetical protein